MEPEDEAFEELTLKQGQWKYTSGWRKKQIQEAQPEQEPVAWPCHIIEADFSERTITLGMECGDYKVSAGTHWLSTTPPPRTWVGLTDREFEEVTHGMEDLEDCWIAIEQALKEKNNG